MKTLRHIAGAAILSALPLAPALAEDVAIVGGTVYTVDEGRVYEDGVVVIEGNEIRAVGGPGTEVPEGFRIIDAAGKWVTPGLMNAYTQLGVWDILLETSTENAVIEDTFFHAGFEVRHGVDPKSPTIPIARIEGLTRAVVVPGPGIPFSQNQNKSIFAGQAAAIHLGDGFDLMVRPHAAVVAYPESNADRIGVARGAVLAYLKGALAESVPDRKKRGDNGGGKFTKSPADRAALARVVEGDVPLYVEENRAAFILQLLELKDEFEDLDLVIMGGAEAWMVADQIAAAGASVVIAPTLNLPASFNTLGATLENAGRLEAAGVTFAITNGGSSSHNADLVRQDAGVAVAHGLSWQGALAAITANPARMFGIGESYGTLAEGMDADVVVWDGDPLEVMTNPEHVFIRGEEIPLESRQTRLRDRYLELDEELPQAYDK